MRQTLTDRGFYFADLVLSICSNSKAVGVPTTPDGFALLPHTYRFLGRYRVGYRTGQ